MSSWANVVKACLKIQNKNQKALDVAQVIECLSSKCEALGSTPSIEKKKKSWKGTQKRIWSSHVPLQSAEQ